MNRIFSLHFHFLILLLLCISSCSKANKKKITKTNILLKDNFNDLPNNSLIKSLIAQIFDASHNFKNQVNESLNQKIRKEIIKFIMITMFLKRLIKLTPLFYRLCYMGFNYTYEKMTNLKILLI